MGQRESGDDLFVPVAVTRASSAIVDQIRSVIVSGRLKPGERLPSERELAAQFGVSRVTVRDALRAAAPSSVRRQARSSGRRCRT